MVDPPWMCGARPLFDVMRLRPSALESVASLHTAGDRAPRRRQPPELPARAWPIVVFFM